MNLVTFVYEQTKSKLSRQTVGKTLFGRSEGLEKAKNNKRNIKTESQHTEINS